MKKLSTGSDSTLENWIFLSKIAFGEESEAVKFLKKKADDSPNGLQEEVIADEVQLITLLANMEESKMYPKKVKFIANKKDNLLYKTGLRKNKLYDTLVDAEEVLKIFEEYGTVTVTNDFGGGHEIEKGDYEIKE